MPFARRLAAAAVLVLALTQPALAERVTALMDLMRLDDLLDIMREEGLEHGAAVGDGVLGQGAGSGWEATVARVYDPARMRDRMEDGLRARLKDAPDAAREAALDEVARFFASDLGRRVVQLELSARRAMLDEAIEEAARDAWAELEAEDGPRAAAVRRFVATGDLVELNVVGGLNATYAFYAGLADSGAGTGGMDEAEMLADVWAQEGAIRTEIDEWLHGYLALAFGPLGDAELEAYTDFFASPSGSLLNSALFAGFNGMFEGLSRDLGMAAGGMMLGEDL